MILGEDFKFKDSLIKNKEDTVPIEIIKGPFKGTILRFTQVAVKENANETATLQFQYDLLKISQDHSEVSLRKNPVFENYIGLILNTLILEAVGPENEQKEKK